MQSGQPDPLFECDMHLIRLKVTLKKCFPIRTLVCTPHYGSLDPDRPSVV